MSNAESEVLFKGLLSKRGRARSALSHVMTPQWQIREIRLLKNGRLQYWQDQLLKGELIIRGSVEIHEVFGTTDGFENAFEVSNDEGDGIIFAASTDESRKQWMRYILSVSRDTWLRDFNLEKISLLVNLPPNQFFQLNESNKAELFTELTKSDVGYDQLFHGRFLGSLVKKFEEYCDLEGFSQKVIHMIYSHTVSFIPIKEKVAEFREGFHSKCIIEDGILLIQFIKGNAIHIHDVGHDLYDVIHPRPGTPIVDEIVDLPVERHSYTPISPRNMSPISSSPKSSEHCHHSKHFEISLETNIEGKDEDTTAEEKDSSDAADVRLKLSEMKMHK